jgi:hypothetical protein
MIERFAADYWAFVLKSRYFFICPQTQRLDTAFTHQILDPGFAI